MPAWWRWRPSFKQADPLPSSTHKYPHRSIPPLTRSHGRPHRWSYETSKQQPAPPATQAHSHLPGDTIGSTIVCLRRQTQMQKADSTHPNARLCKCVTNTSSQHAIKTAQKAPWDSDSIIQSRRYNSLPNDERVITKLKSLKIYNCRFFLERKEVTISRMAFGEKKVVRKCRNKTFDENGNHCEKFCKNFFYFYSKKRWVLLWQ